MAKFIEVTDNSGSKRLINTAWIEEIWNDDGAVTIYLAFNYPNAVDQDFVRVKESYEEIKNAIALGNW